MDERASGSTASIREATRLNSQSGKRRIFGNSPGGTPASFAGLMPAAAIAALAHTPGGAFGSCRYKLKSLDGVYGIRVSHNVELTVSGFGMSK